MKRFTTGILSQQMSNNNSKYSSIKTKVQEMDTENNNSRIYSSKDLMSEIAKTVQEAYEGKAERMNCMYIDMSKAGMPREGYTYKGNHMITFFVMDGSEIKIPIRIDDIINTSPFCAANIKYHAVDDMESIDFNSMASATAVEKCGAAIYSMIDSIAKAYLNLLCAVGIPLAKDPKHCYEITLDYDSLTGYRKDNTCHTPNMDDTMTATQIHREFGEAINKALGLKDDKE